MIKFTVFGEPTAQGRPRFTTRGGHAMAYDPKESRDYKQNVRAAAIEVKPDVPLDGPLSLVVTVYKSIPKSLSKKKQAAALAGELRPTTKPDCSNLCKGIEDALKGLIFKDDSQIVDLRISKFYSQSPRAEVSIIPY